MQIRTYLHTSSGLKEILNLHELKITQTINNHAALLLTAKLTEDTDEAKLYYIGHIQSLDVIEVMIEESDDTESEAKTSYPRTLFKGVLKNVHVQRLDKHRFLVVEALSSSYLADIEINSRSFQDENETYESIVNKVITTPFSKDGTSRKIGRINDRATDGKTTGEFVMQYRETDWEFIKRMSSRFYLGLVPSLIFDTPSITMGIPYGRNVGDIEKYNFIAKKDLQKYLNMSQNTEFNQESGKGEFTELDAVTFYVETTDEFNIGDKLMYQYNKEEAKIGILYIKSKEIEMVGGVLRFHYELSTERGLCVPKIWNEKIVGLSLQGVVMERIQDTVKVFLEIDDEPPAPAWKFPYSTPYTAEGNAGWYVMPELEDTVYIYFPNKEEKYGIGLNGVRVKNKGTDKIANPEIKYLRTRNGKELKLAPDEIVLTCINQDEDEEAGIEENKIYIQLNQDSGITIQSTKPIHINSDGNIHFTADKDIIFEALEEIKLKSGTKSQIKMDDAIEIVSSIVKVN